MSASRPDTGDSVGVFVLGGELVFLAACVAAMSRGVEGGRWLAVVVMLVMFLQNLVLSLFELTSSSTAMWGFVAAGVCLAAVFVLWFTEPVGDFLYRRLPLEASADWDGVMKDLAGAAAPGAPSSPPARPPVSADALLEGARKRRFWGRLSLLSVGSVLLISTALLVMMVVSTIGDVVEIRGGLDASVKESLHSVGSASGLGEGVARFVVALFVTEALAFIMIMLPILGAFALAFFYFAFFVAPFGFTLPLTFPLAMSWTRPARFLLLRPFHRRRLTAGLVRFLRRHVVSFGHTYTLADTTLKVPWYVRFPALLGQVSLLSFRFRKIRHPAHVYRACRALRRTRLRNMNWLLSLHKIFTLACSDMAWRAVVSRLLGEVDLVFIDVTGIRQNVVWEVEQCIRMGKIERMIFIVDEREREAAQRALAGVAGGAISREMLLYDSTGARDTGHATAVIARALADNGGPGAFTPPALPPPWRDDLRRRTLRRGLIALAVVVAIALIARHS